MNNRNVVVVGNLLTTTELPPTADSIGIADKFEYLIEALGSRALGSHVAEELIETFSADPHDENTRTIAFAAVMSANDSVIFNSELRILDYLEGYDSHLGFRLRAGLIEVQELAL